MNRAERRKNKWKKVRQRLQLLHDIWHSYRGKRCSEPIIGKYSNNNYVNRGCPKKTNTRKSQASWRHHGGHGEAMKWSARDLRQISDMDQQMRELDSCY